MSDTSELATAGGSLARVQSEVAQACADAGRDPASVTLIAVSKTHAAETIEPVIAAGQRVFGENRVQEAKSKWPALTARHPGIALHLIGALQSNKAKEAVALFDAIHTVDLPSIVGGWLEITGRAGPCCSWKYRGGTAKAGVLPEQADAFVAASGNYA